MTNLWDLVQQIADPDGWREKQAKQLALPQQNLSRLQDMYDYKEKYNDAYFNGSGGLTLQDISRMERDKWHTDMGNIYSNPATQVYRANMKQM